MKPKLLVLTPRYIYPPIGGDRLRIYQICKELSKDFDLTLLSMCESAAEVEMPVPEDGVFSSVDRVLHQRWRRLIGCLRTLPTSTPLQVGYYQNRAFEKRLRELIPSYDGLLAHLIRTGAYVTPFRIPKVLEMTDAISLSYERTVAHVGPLRKAVYRIEAKRLKQYERDIVERCDLTVLVSKIDRNFLFPNGGRKLLVCSNGVDTQSFPFQFHPDGKTIIFIGKNIAHYNVDGILYFAEEILPLVKSRYQDAQFKVIGQIRPEFKRELERRGILVTGAVENVAEAARSATVGVCPLRIGAGVQNKLLEYMALGVPAVTSAIGLEGIDAIPNVHLLTAETPQEWADQIIRLLLDRDESQKLAGAARRFIEGHHSWSSTLASLRSSVKEIMTSTKWQLPSEDSEYSVF